MHEPFSLSGFWPDVTEAHFTLGREKCAQSEIGPAQTPRSSGIRASFSRQGSSLDLASGQLLTKIVSDPLIEEAWEGQRRWGGGEFRVRQGRKVGGEGGGKEGEGWQDESESEIGGVSAGEGGSSPPSPSWPRSALRQETRCLSPVARCAS